MMSSFGGIKTSVKDSLEEDEGSEDVEDEVFIRDGRNSCRIDEDIKRPLMAPRRKCKQNIAKRDHSRRRCFFKICSPYCKISMALFILTCVALLLITLFNDFPQSLERLKLWAIGPRKVDYVVIPSTLFSKEEIWRRSFPNLKSEDSLTLTKLNSDNIEDIVVGYSSGETRCGDTVCLGGALALDGKTGATIWQAQTRHQVLFVDCSANVDHEPTYDCLLSGKSGVLCIVSGKTGMTIWELPPDSDDSLGQVQVYSAQYVPDMDGDGWSDVMVALTLHTSSNLSVLSGHSGATLGQIITPARLLTLPRIITTQDEILYVLFATGTLDTPGFLFSTPLYSIIHSDKSKVRKLWSGDGGVSSDLLLLDMNLDQREDVVLTSGGNIVILDGNNFSNIWNISLGPLAQILVGPIPAYFDDDKYPDLLVTKLVGESFPTFYYSETQVFSGRDGSRLLEDSVIGSGDITGEGISVSFTGYGNDMYLYWLTTCHQSDKNQTKPFKLSPEVEATADLCKLRFNTTLETRLMLLSDHIQPPGFILYSSEKSWSEEHPIETITTPQQLDSPADTQLTPEIENIDDRVYVQPDSVDAWDYPDSLTRLAGIKSEGPEYDNRPYAADTMPLDYPNKIAETLENMVDGNKIAEDFDGEPNKLGMGYDNVRNRNKMSEPYDNTGDGADYVVSRKKRRALHHTVPRSSTTPVLAPGLSGSVDIIFASHWITLSDIASRVRCLHRKASRQGMRSWESEKLDRECQDIPNETESQLTVYRLKMSSQCYHLDAAKETCSQPFPAYSQSFSHRDTHQYFKKRIHPQ